MSTENLSNQEAIAKIQEMVDHIDIGMLSTFVAAETYPHTVPMSRQEVDAEGNIWFLCSAESDTHQHLLQNNQVSIAYAHVGDYKFMSINGRAEISKDPERIEKYWNKFHEAWFEKGKEDPAIRILKVIPQEAHYWDNKSNKLFTMLKLAASVVTGKPMDIGHEGKLDL